MVLAERCYQEALALAPEQPDALQLLAGLARRRGEVDAAESLYRRSLQAKDTQPQVWNSLGNLLVRAGRGDEALACFDQALSLDPAHAEARYNRARVLHARGLFQDAYDTLTPLWSRPEAVTPAMLQLKAQIESDGGHIDTALATLEGALQLAPERAALHHNRAVLLQRQHRFAEALAGHERALSLGLNAADAFYNHGNTLQSLGRSAQAMQAYRQALALQPQHELALYDLARLRWRLGDPDFDDELVAAAAADARSATGPGIRANLLYRAERYADACAAFARALERAPQAAGFHDGLGRCLVRLGDVEASLAAHRRAIDIAPGQADLHANHAASLLMARRPELALAEAELARALAPHDQYALALVGLAWRALGDAREAWLNDYPRFVQVCDLEPPPGWADMAAFNTALADELRALHADREAPIDQTLRRGTQTLGDIFDQGHPLVNALKGQIALAIDAYVAGLPDDPTHPFLNRRASAWKFADSWSSRLRNSGFHTAHVHPHGWISSAYYVVVPPSCADTQQHQGWLRFGQPDMEMGLGDLARRSEAPRAGRLVLFPSMFWHGTTPFAEGSERLSVAFDVQPI